MKNIVDLHAHTVASDGSCTPTELVRYAKEKGLAALAVTDHDTVAGLNEAKEAGERFGVKIIPGVELGTRVDGCDVHLVALFIDDKNEELLSSLDEMSECRKVRNLKMIDKLKAAGFQIDRSDLLKFRKDQNVARGLIAQLLVDRGYGDTTKEVTTKYLGKDTVGYVEKEVFSPEECIRLVHGAGGLVFVAHLHQIDPKDPDHCEEICRRLIELGADGLETLYCEFDDHWRAVTEKIATDYGCLRSGGSDFHGRIKKGLDLAIGYGDLKVPYSFVEAMEEKLENNRKGKN
ncbi:MAG: PHP domain-containing protein [Eubacteriales bacterium]|nr:PHP domain-containing protein [Eubacteriales bacterium]